MMRGPAPTLLTDWLAIAFRWLALFGMTVSLALANNLPWTVLPFLVGAAAWNTFLTLVGGFNRHTPSYRFVSLGIDLLVAYSSFYLSGGLNGPLVWVGVLPLISASLYFQFKGALVAAFLSMVIQGGTILLDEPLLKVLAYEVVLVPLYLIVGILIGYPVQRINQDLPRSLKTRQNIQPAGRANGQTEIKADGEGSERERRQVIYNLISDLSATLNYQKVLDMAMDLSTGALSTFQSATDKLACAVLLFSQNEKNQADLHVGSARRLPAADMHTTMPGTQGLIAQAIEEGRPALTEEVNKDPELSQLLGLQVCKSAYCIPLRTGIDTYGVLLFAHPEASFFNADNREILDIVGNQAVIAIQNARLYQDLEQEKERMMQLQDEARKKMARDLHDGPTQSVAAIAMRVNFARRLMEKDLKATGDELYKIEELARRTTKEIRHMLFTLRPLVLESQGLAAALQSLAEKMRDTFNLNVTNQADSQVAARLEPGKQAVAFYIAEEAINNARKHAHAEHIWVRLKALRNDLALLEIEDDGVGFDLNAIDASYENRGSLGMVNMRERAELVNGVLHVESAVGRGTHIQVVIPLTEEAADRIRHGL